MSHQIVLFVIVVVGVCCAPVAAHFSTIGFAYTASSVYSHIFFRAATLYHLLGPIIVSHWTDFRTRYAIPAKQRRWFDRIKTIIFISLETVWEALLDNIIIRRCTGDIVIYCSGGFVIGRNDRNNNELMRCRLVDGDRFGFCMMPICTDRYGWWRVGHRPFVLLIFPCDPEARVRPLEPVPGDRMLLPVEVFNFGK